MHTKHVPASLQLADIFTKPLGHLALQSLWSKLGLLSRRNLRGNINQNQEEKLARIPTKKTFHISPAKAMTMISSPIAISDHTSKSSKILFILLLIISLYKVVLQRLYNFLPYKHIVIYDYIQREGSQHSHSVRDIFTNTKCSFSS